MTRRAFVLLLLLLASVGAVAQEPTPDEEFQKAFFFGRKFADLGEYSSAYEQFARADALKPDQAPVLYDMAVVLARAGRYSEAQVKADRYLQLFPEGAEKPLLTRLQLELEFQRELQKKRQGDQEYADLFNRAKYVYGQGDLDQALQLFVQAEQLRPADAAAVFNEAVVLEKREDLARAIERYRHYAELENDVTAKSKSDQKIFALQHELEERKSTILCPFCGHKLPVGATWCERCWHGPYLVSSSVWNSRPCAEGASATRTTYFSDARFNRNDVLPCMLSGTMLDSLRYTAARQRAIQDARKAEGWTYAGDVIQGWSDAAGNQIRYLQGADYLESVSSAADGKILRYAAHAGGPGVWLLDREDLVIDAQQFTSRYTFDAAGRIAQQQVEYQNATACNHLIAMTADYAYQNGALSSVALHGGYDGFTAEGAPRTDWRANVAFSYDPAARLVKEELAVTSFEKTYTQKPQGALREEIARLYPGMRVKKPLDSMQRVGDLCAMSGDLLLSNPIDLRPFYAMSPSLAIALQNGVSRAVVTYTYPDH